MNFGVLLVVLVAVLGWYLLVRYRRRGQATGQWRGIEEHERAMRAVGRQSEDEQP